MHRILFVGLGTMGEPMAANLLTKGFAVTAVGHRRPEPLARLAALGATPSGDLARAAGEADVAIVMLPSSAEVEAVVAGPGGLAESLRRGSLVVDCSTSDPASTRRLGELLAARGIGMVDAPVTRGVAAAKQGTLAYFVGGSEADFAKVEPCLGAMGDTFHHMGALGNGHATKLLTNALSYATVAAVGEMLMIGDRLGLDPASLQQALVSGAGSKALEAFGPRIAAREYQKPRVVVRNVRAHLDTAMTLVPDDAARLAVLKAAQDSYRRVAGLGHDESDVSAVAELWSDGGEPGPAATHPAS